MGQGYSAKKNLSRSIYVIYRKIRFLKRRGTLFRKKPLEKPTRKTKPDQSTLRGRSYHIYRKLRYLIHTGKIFKKSPKVKKGHTLNYRIVFRKVRYLIRRRKIWNAVSNSMKMFFRDTFAFLGSRYLIILINSTALFLLAYLLVYLVTQVSVMIAAISFNIDTVLYYYDIDFLIRASEWVPDAVKVVYTTGPFVSLILAILSVIIYVNITEETWIFRLFILWVFCHSFIHFFGEFLMGNLLGKGFGFVIMYLFFLDTPKMVLTLFDFIIILFTGVALARLFLFSANIYLNKLDKSNRMPFVLSQLFLPFLIGTCIILLIKLPKITSLEISVDFSMIILLLPVIFRAKASQDLYFEEEKKRIKPFWIVLIATVVLSVLFRIILGTGVRI